MNLLRQLTVSAAVLVLLSLSNASYAEDQKVYPGTACLAYYPSDAAGLTRTPYSLFAGERSRIMVVAVPLAADP